MARKKKAEAKFTLPNPADGDAISSIWVEGYKSLLQKTEVKIRPLTLLAGANSSGKSSLLQPFLLMKQTLEAPYDPGALLLNGPHLRLSSFDQLFSRNEKGPLTDQVSAGFQANKGQPFSFIFVRAEASGIQVKINADWSGQAKQTPLKKTKDNPFRVDLVNRIFFTPYLLRILHIPALRGNPQRAYGITAVGANFFPGPFDPYVASIIHRWQTQKDPRLQQLNAFLQTLGLTSSVQATRINDALVELNVSRLRTEASNADFVSIADVGFGVSQIMPLLVGLLAAKEGQLVYIEQPEIHLHPKAQVALATILAHAANRGVRVVAETHSALLLLGIQTLVAQQKLSPNQVALHWFERMEDGMSRVTSAELDESGAFGDWPEDFDDVTLSAQSEYMNAAERRLISGQS